MFGGFFLETIKGFVKHIIFKNPQNGYIIFKLVSEETEITCKGTLVQLDEGEFLDVYKVPLETAFEKCMNGEIKDAKTIIGILKTRELKKNGGLS